MELSRVRPRRSATTVIRELTDVDVVDQRGRPVRVDRGSACARRRSRRDCHYVDINGEVDVYRKLDDLGRHAAQRNAGHRVQRRTHGGRIRSAAGCCAATSSGSRSRRPPIVGSVRIRIVSRILGLSRGSPRRLHGRCASRSRVVAGEVSANRGPGRGAVFWHEPVGKLERTFDFRDSADAPGRPQERTCASHRRPTSSTR